MRRLAYLVLTVASASAGVAGCQSSTPAGTTYFDRVIEPILNQSCSRGVSGCHSVDPADPFAFAAGNLDTTSLANLYKRDDVLHTFGVYPAPFLLMKAVAQTSDLQINYGGMQYSSNITHVGGNVLTVGSPAFLTLQTWLENGAQEDGIRPDPAPVDGIGPCSNVIPASFVEASVTSTTQWTNFNAEFDGVQSVISRQTCNAGNCHGAQQSDFYLTCGTDIHQKAFNFSQVWGFVGSPVDSSEILRRPVAGGAVHTGGAHFTGLDDPDYMTIAQFATDVGPETFGMGDPQRTFFAQHIMPIFLTRGCAAEGCHSPAAMNDFKLRSGTQGFFSPIALEKNYQLAKNDFLAFEVPDVRRGRIIAKNVSTAHGGIAHRGGPLLEFGNADPTTCTTYDPATATMFCTFFEWARLERLAMGNPNAGATIPLVYVERSPTHIASLLNVGVHQAGSDLLVRNASIDPITGAITGVDAPVSLLGACPGTLATRDVRSPDVKNDGDTVVFALRADATDTLQIYTTKISDSSACTKISNDGAGVQDFDPAWSPDGGLSIVYASTKAGGMSHRLNLPQSDLWRMQANGSSPERMTFLSNSEIGPQFNREGRVILTTEKVDIKAPMTGFYQLSGRRINWDLTDYHPLLAQRAQSPVDPSMPGTLLPSVSYQQATELREGFDGDFMMVFSNAGAVGGAGTIAIFNRSVGPFEADRTDPGFLKSVTIPDPTGVYRSPFPTLDGKVMASYAAGADAMTAATLPWQIVVLDPVTGTNTPVFTNPGKADVEGVLAIQYPARELYVNRRQLVFGGLSNGSDTTHATVHFPDMPMMATLFGANLRRGRNAQNFDVADTLSFFDATGTFIGSAPLASDGSVRFSIKAQTPVYMGLFQGSSQLFMMTEEHQFGPGENISIGVRRDMFDHTCAGCHGSNSGKEIDVGVTTDVLTSASVSVSQTATPTQVGP